MKILTAILLTVLCTGATGQMRHDPLNDREVEQMRENSQEPKKRIDLLIAFSRERMLAIDRLRSATKPGIDDPSKIAELLTDLAALIDELDDNLAMFNGHSEDLRRPLEHVLSAEAELEQKLTSLHDNATPLQKRRFSAALEDASDSLKSSTESARAMLADQFQKKGEEKNKEKSDRREGGDLQPPRTPDAAKQQTPDSTGTGGAGRRPSPH